MNKEIPVASKLIKERDLVRNNKRLFEKIISTKGQYSNISSIRYSPEKKMSKAHPIDLTKIMQPGEGTRRVKTVLAKERIQSQNKGLFQRLVHQKSTINTKHLAQERLKNIQHLKRIGRFPFKRVHSVIEERVYQTPQRERCREGEGQDEGIHRHQKTTSTYIRIGDTYRDKQHLIVLYSKVLHLKAGWHHINILRYKNHYEIQVAAYPTPKHEYYLQLPELVGTALLSQIDYDYMYIIQNCIKFNKQYICFVFQLVEPERKRYFYRFDIKGTPITRQSTNEREQREQKEQKEQKEQREEKKEECSQLGNSDSGRRRTMFALELQRKQKQEQKTLKTVQQQSESQQQFDFRRLNSVAQSDIQLLQQTPDQKCL